MEPPVSSHDVFKRTALEHIHVPLDNEEIKSPATKRVAPRSRSNGPKSRRSRAHRSPHNLCKKALQAAAEGPKGTPSITNAERYQRHTPSSQHHRLRAFRQTVGSRPRHPLASLGSDVAPVMNFDHRVTRARTRSHAAPRWTSNQLALELALRTEATSQPSRT